MTVFREPKDPIKKRLTNWLALAPQEVAYLRHRRNWRNWRNWRARPRAANARSVTPSNDPPPPPPELATVTIKVAELAADATGLVQVSVYVNVPAAMGVIVWLPLTAFAPLQLPAAAQLVVLMEDQLSVVEAPTVTVVALSESVGGPAGRSASAASAWMNP